MKNKLPHGPHGEAVDNVTIHYFPNSQWFIKAAVYMRNGRKIICSFCMVDTAAAESFLIRQGWQDLPVKYFTHKGGSVK